MKNILVVEDDEEVALLVESSLRSPNYDISVVKTGSDGLEAYDRLHPDMMVLDLNLPGVDGIEICRRIRKTDEYTPIFVITGRKEEIDRVVALRLGVDDYIVKPFYGRELRARVDRFFQRWESVMGRNSRSSIGGEEMIARGDLVIDVKGHRVIYKDSYIDLSGREFEVLTLLAEAPGKVFSREAILDSIYGADSGTDVRAVDNLVKRVRARLDKADAGREWILTVRGTGYSFTSYYERFPGAEAAS